jgi:hypothetical protein
LKPEVTSAWMQRWPSWSRKAIARRPSQRQPLCRLEDAAGSAAASLHATRCTAALAHRSLVEHFERVLAHGGPQSGERQSAKYRPSSRWDWKLDDSLGR